MSKPYHIVIADDDVDDQLIIKSTLSKLGTQVTISSVYDGAELLALLHSREELPDMIILDINMPVMDGLEALTQIKEHDQLKEIPVYVLSTVRSREKFEASRHMGARECFSKPNTFAAYREIVDRIISEAG
jgi:CheY-like chemotaxis protein